MHCARDTRNRSQFCIPSAGGIDNRILNKKREITAIYYLIESYLIVWIRFAVLRVTETPAKSQ